MDAYVTPERIILLDTQPLFSPAVLASMLLEDTARPAKVRSLLLACAYLLEKVRALDAIP